MIYIYFKTETTAQKRKLISNQYIATELVGAPPKCQMAFSMGCMIH
jgi:hypothetical protein